MGTALIQSPEMHRVRPEIARVLNGLLRCGALRLAEWAFRGTIDDGWCRRELFGFDMYLDASRSAAQRMLYVMGERFVQERSLLAGLVRPGMCVVDVGANIGYYLLMFERLVGERGRVTCIEPSPDNLVELRRNIEANGFQNVVLHEVAVGAAPGWVSVSGGINCGIVAAADGRSEVPLERLDALVNGPVDLVKIDVEGYEGQVLDGSVDLLRRDRPVLFLEVHPHLLRHFGNTAGSVVERLRPIYPRMTAYETPRPLHGSFLRKAVALRRRAPARVDDLDRLVEESDRHQHDWTFWLVCEEGTQASAT